MRGFVAVVGGGLLLSGCVGVAGDAPKRPPVTLADEVQQVDRAEIVGSWTCRELNPYPEVPQQVSTITYADDGTFTGKARYDATTPPFAGMTVESGGTWAVAGDRIVTSDVRTSAGSDDPFTNVMAGIATSFANSFAGQQQGSGDVLELTKAKLVFRLVGVDDPPVYACTRS